MDAATRKAKLADAKTWAVLHTFDFRRPDMPPPLVWAPPTEVPA